MNYRPDIDGLRAIAVLAVLFYHAHLGLPGGYVGVDVFFVISGYLITSILLKSLSKGSFSYSDFWKRRVRRLVPALCVMTLLTALAAYFVLLPADLVDLSGALFSQPLLASNVYFWRVVQAGYFGDPPEIRPLLHTWSLGVEEQFYLLFPAFLILSRRIGGNRRGVVWCLFLSGGLSLIISVKLTPVKGVAAFFNLPTRAWELLLGGLLTQAPAPRRLGEPAAWLGLVAIVYSCLSFTHHTPFPGSAALIPTLGTALLLWGNAKKSGTTVGKMLSARPLVLVGLISYSSYLWHWPLMAFGDYLGLLSSLAARWLVLSISLMMGYLSWRVLETPFRDHPRLKSGKNVAVFFLAYASLCWLVGFVYRAHQGFPDNWSQQAISVHQPRMDFRSFTHDVDPLAAKPRLRQLGDAKASRTTFLLWGDSHAMAVAPVLDALGKQYGLKGLMLTRSSTPPLVSWTNSDLRVQRDERFQAAWSDLALQTIREEKISTVFLHASWPKYFSPTFDSDARQTQDTLRQQRAKPVWVSSVLRILGPLSDSPHRWEPLKERWPFLSSWVKVTRFETSSEYAERNRELLTLLDRFAQRDRTQVLLPAATQDTWKTLNPEGLPSYKDAGHLTDFGALRLRECFEPTFRKLAASKG